MEVTAEDIVIVGAGIAGLATALGLHRRGVKRFLVLESADHLRASGFALATWTNAWKSLDALGVGDSLRRQHVRLHGLVAASTATGLTTSTVTFMGQGKCGEHEVRCVRRNLLVEALERELPSGTIKFCSKVVMIEEQGNLKILHLADGSIIKTKVLIGCDGVNSVVAKWLGLRTPAYAGRSASRGIVEFPDGHSFKPQFLQYFGDGFRSGFLPCDEKHVYWFFTYTPSAQDKELEVNMLKMKQFVLSKLGKVPQEVMEVIEKSEPSSIISSPLRYRWPCDLLWGQICKGNVCLAGDALHAMTPDLGQGGCSALEDGVVLARCLAEAFLGESINGEAIMEEHDRIKMSLEKYVKQRKWRSVELISTAYVVGLIQQTDGAVMSMLRDKWLSAVMARKLLRMSEFDCGKLSSD